MRLKKTNLLLLFLISIALFSCEQEFVVIEEKPKVLIVDTIIQQQTITIQDTLYKETKIFKFKTEQTESAIDDANVSELETNDSRYQSNGRDIKNAAIAWTNFSAGEASYDVRSIIKFNEIDLIDDKVIVDSAFITLHVVMPFNSFLINGPHGNNNVSIHTAQEDWEEYQVSWVTLPSFDENSFVSTSIITTENDSIRQEVTPFVQDMITNNNYGFILKIQDEDRPLASVTFHSSEVTEQNNRPYLTIYYHEE